MDTLEHSDCGKYFYRAVVFDLDGTLLNTLDDLSTAVNLLCREKHWRGDGFWCKADGIVDVDG